MKDMSEFMAKSVCILGRLPALGLAELESLYGSDHLKTLENAALLDIPAEEINFKRLGGTIKVARILAEIPSTKWAELAKYLADKIPEHLKHLPEGKFTLGISVYGLRVDVAEINRTALQIKKIIKQSGRPVRIVPNKAVALNSAQVLHNKLTYKGAWELLYIKNGSKTLLAQTMFIQDIDAYAARDQARPARDPRVGMLPPKLAQTIINLAAGRPETRIGKRWDSGDGLGRFLVLDPFCGTGVILQEALLMGYSVYGTDIDPRMVDYTKKNLQWLVKNKPEIEGKVTIEQADATSYQWPGFSTIASEVFLGRSLAKFPDEMTLKQVISDANTIIKKFLKNLAPQLKTDQVLCLAIPAWRRPGGQMVNLPVIDHLTEMGYNYWDLKHVSREDLVYYREDQVVTRRLLRLKKA
ncbi:methyltransferase domain-containing protein [Candidatus Saccharibacteria bacterium]|nr:methyltransferase domain-containing protein [Candidatus Saccharibacteria bacterium]